jgi:DNA-binding Lrp family transcriptional regulator
MVTAIVTLKVNRNKVAEIAAKLSGMEGITEVYSVSGRFDLIALVRTRDADMLASIVTGTMLKVDGILDSETMFAFRTYSKHDLESMFSIGADD